MGKNRRKSKKDKGLSASFADGLVDDLSEIEPVASKKGEEIESSDSDPTDSSVEEESGTDGVESQGEGQREGEEKGDEGQEEEEEESEDPILGLDLMEKWQEELKVLVAEDLDLEAIRKLSPMEVRVLCSLTLGKAQKFCEALAFSVGLDNMEEGVVEKGDREERMRIERYMREQGERVLEMQRQMEGLAAVLAKLPLPKTGMATPDLTASETSLSPAESSSLQVSTPPQAPLDQWEKIDLVTPAERAMEEQQLSARRFGSAVSEEEARRKIRFEEPPAQLQVSAIEKMCREYLAKKEEREMVGQADVYGDAETLQKLLPNLEWFKPGVPDLRELKVFEQSVSRLIGELKMEKATKEEVAYWLFDAARSLREIKGRLGKLPFILIDFVYVTTLFGKQQVPMSVREAQRRGEQDPLVVPRTLYREYCNRLVLSTIFERLTRGGSSVREWWAKVQMGGQMCEKAFREQYSKFISQGGDFVERAAEGVEATFRAKGEQFEPTQVTVDVICNQVQNDLIRYRKNRVARVHVTEGVLEEEEDMLREYFEQLRATSPGPVAEVRAVDPRGRRPMTCYNCYQEGHLAFRCEKPCRTHAGGGPRSSCSKCEERFKQSVRSRNGFPPARAPQPSTGGRPQSSSTTRAAPAAAASSSGSGSKESKVPSAAEGGSGGG